jgi:hypothetical protein
MRFILTDSVDDEGHTQLMLHYESHREVGVLGQFVADRDYRSDAERATAREELLAIAGPHPVIERP